jgi:hypothetical protein
MNSKKNFKKRERERERERENFNLLKKSNNEN